MNREEQRRLREVLRRRTGSPAIFDLAMDDDLVDALRIDSLTALEALAAVEKEFGVLLPDEDLHELRTLRRIASAVDDYTAEFGREGEATCASD